MLKRIIVLIICVVMTFVILPVPVKAANYGNAITDNLGRYTGLYWSLDSSGILTISGTGEMLDYTTGSAPVYAGTINGTNIAPRIKNVIIEEGVSYVGTNAFSNAGLSSYKGTNNIQSVHIASSVKKIGQGAFADKSLQTIYIHSEDVLFDDVVMSSNAIIFGYEGSTAEEYAEKNGNEFRLLCEEHNPVTIDHKSATCNEGGYTGYIACSVCGDVIQSGEKIDALGHDYDLMDVVNPTCTKEGYSGDLKCTRCGEIKETGEELPKTEHDFGPWTVVAISTCSSEGQVMRHCNNCEEYEEARIEKLDHSWNTDYTIDIPATYESCGEESIHCSACGMIKENSTKVIPKLERIDISQDAEISGIKNLTYIGKALTQNPVIKLNDITLQNETDYTIAYKNNINAGTATVTITGKGNYMGTVSKTFTINKANVSSASVSGISAKTYTGKALTQSPVVKLNNITLKNGTDYTVTYKNNTNAGTATVTVTGKGNYTGSTSKTFKINAKKITPTIKLSKTSVKYNGKVQKPTVTVYNGGTKLAVSQYTVTWPKGFKNVGSYTIKVTLKGNYSGSKSIVYKITKASQPMAAKVNKKTVAYSKLKSKAQVVSGGITIAKAQGKVTYAKAGGSANLTINKTTGKITVKKGTKKGTYKIKVNVTVTGNASYNKGTKTVTVSVVVK